MEATALKTFMRDGEQIQAGQTFQCGKWEFQKWRAMGFIQPYETKAATPAKAEPVKEKPTAKKKAAKKKATSKKK